MCTNHILAQSRLSFFFLLLCKEDSLIMKTRKIRFSHNPYWYCAGYLSTIRHLDPFEIWIIVHPYDATSRILLEILNQKLTSVNPKHTKNSLHMLINRLVETINLIINSGCFETD